VPAPFPTASPRFFPRDQRLARRLATDPGETNRLIDQAWWSIRARRLRGLGIMGWFN
jgi:hypothetical protein